MYMLSNFDKAWMKQFPLKVMSHDCGGELAERSFESLNSRFLREECTPAPSDSQRD